MSRPPDHGRGLVGSNKNKQKCGHRRLRLLAGACLLWAAAAVPAPVWSVVLGTLDAERPIGPRERLEFLISDTSDPRRLLATLDGMDVTAILRVEGNRAIMTPGESLANGRHTLVVFRESLGKPEAIGRFDFQVTGAVDTRYDLYASADIGARLNTDESNDEFMLDAAFGFDAEAIGDDWRAAARADFFALNESPYSDYTDNDHRDIDVGDFLFSVEKGRLGAQLGHHRPGPESLVLRGFNRRGASATWRDKNDRFAATSFAFRSEPVSGFEHGLGIGNAEQRVMGAVASATIPSAADTEVSVTWLTGQDGLRTGIGVIDEVGAREGDAWSVAVVTKPLDEALSIRGEYARSVFFQESDENGERAEAWSLSMESNHVLRRSDERQVTWRSGAELRRIGTFFESLGNPGLPTDVESARGYAGLSGAGFDLYAQVERQRNNVDGIARLPTIRTDIATISAGYTPVESPEDPRWYGRPSLNVSWSNSEQVLEENPASLPFDLDLTLEQATLSASFYYPRWHWRVSHTSGEILDRTGIGANTENRLTELSFSAHGRERFWLSSRVQSGEVENTDTGEVTERQLFALNLRAILVPRKFSAVLGLNIASDETSSGIDRDTRVINLGLNWTMREATTGRSGIALWLRGQSADTDETIERIWDQDDDQIMLGVSLDYAR